MPILKRFFVISLCCCYPDFFFLLPSLILFIKPKKFRLQCARSQCGKKIECRSVWYADAVCFDSVLTFADEEMLYIQAGIAHCHYTLICFVKIHRLVNCFLRKIVHNTSKSSSSRTNSIRMDKKKIKCLFRCANITVEEKKNECTEMCGKLLLLFLIVHQNISMIGFKWFFMIFPLIIIHSIVFSYIFFSCSHSMCYDII